MANSVYKHIAASRFYVLYNVIRLHFKGSYDIAKYGTFSQRFSDAYERDKLKVIYDKLCLRIDDDKHAILLIVSNFLENVNGFITNFSLEPEYYNLFRRYSKNKFAILDDFSVLCNNIDVYSLVENGELANDVVIRKNNIILFSYVNKILPLVTLSLSNIKQSTPDIVMDLFYNVEPPKPKKKGRKKKPEKSVFDKLAVFIHLTEQEKEYMLPKLTDIFILNKPQMNNDYYAMLQNNH